MIRVFIADDQASSRDHFRGVLADTNDIQVVGESANDNDLFEWLEYGKCDMLLLEINLDGKCDMDVLRQIKMKYPRLPILVLSTHREDQYAARALRAGASGFIPKSCTPALLISAIHRIFRGGVYISSAVADRLVRDLGADNHDAIPHILLSDRELEIFHLIVAGQSLTQVAQVLSLSVKTISTHKTRILKKLQARGTADLVRYAIHHGFIDTLRRL